MPPASRSYAQGTATAKFEADFGTGVGRLPNLRHGTIAWRIIFF